MEDMVKLLGEEETDPNKAVLKLAKKMEKLMDNVSNCPKCTNPMRPVKWKCSVCDYEKEVKHDARLPKKEQEE